MRIVFVFLFAMAAVTVSVAQNFIGEAPLPAITADGFYRIEIDPAFDPYLKDDLLNVRIIDTDGHEIPYLLQQPPRVLHTQQFRAYKILENKHERKRTTLTLVNKDSLPINNISLWIKNADVLKTAVLLGSDDGENWFALKHDFVIGPFINPEGVSEINIVDFPLSNYQYYRFILNDSVTAPINILRSGFYEAITENIYPVVIPSRITERDTTGKRTCVLIHFDSARIVDALSVRMGSMPYFLRDASLFTREYVIDKKGRKQKQYRLLDEFQVSSKQSAEVVLSGRKVSGFLLLINNEDSPPLHVRNISAYQVHRYYTAWLQAGKQYTLKIGGVDTKPPLYDLKFFQDSIPASPSLLKPGKLTIYKQTTPATSSPAFFARQSIVWLALFVITGLLSLMSVRLLKDMRK